MREFGKTICSILRVTIVTLVLYVAIVVLVSFIPYGGQPVIYRLLPMQDPGGDNYSLTRFREAGAKKEVDIMFIGPSHAYRGFDPRFFSGMGYTSQNLGSTSQTPLNSYCVLDRHLGHLKPKVVVYMIYQTAFGLDGMESFYDLLSNTPVDWPMLRMTAGMLRPQAWTALLATGIRNSRVPMSSHIQRHNPSRQDLYIEGGYVETRSIMPAERLARLRSPQAPWDYTMDERQFEYLAKCIELVRGQNAAFVACSYPIPVESRGHLADYEKNQQTIGRFLAKEGVPYRDFNQDMTLDTATYYYDEVHLNQAGVDLFSEALAKWLRLHSLLPATGATVR